MKCPICGKEEIIKAPNLPFYVSGDARLFENGCTCYSCANCGYTMLINEEIHSYVYAQKEAIDLLERKIDEKKNRLAQLKASSEDTSHLREQLEKFKKQLKMRRELGDDNKATRALEESISELTEEIKSSPNSSTKSLEYDIVHLEEEVQKIKDTITPVFTESKKIVESINDNDGEKIWNLLTSVYQTNDPSNNKTISISRELSKSALLVLKVIEKAKADGYRPFGFTDSASLIVVLDKEEKKVKTRPYLKVLTLEEFLQES